MKNVGTLDRVIRFVLTFVFFAIGSLLVDGMARIGLYVLSLAMIVTATTGFCGLYKIFKIDTRSKK